MKTDTLFYRLFQSFPSIFFELIQQPPTTADNYQFASVEVKQLSFRIDGVFLPQAIDLIQRVRQEIPNASLCPLTIAVGGNCRTNSRSLEFTVGEGTRSRPTATSRLEIG